MSHAPKLRQLRYLTSLAERHHFGLAAKDCHVSQSTLSAGLQELEDSLGVTLVERSNKRVMLTRIGEEVVQRSKQILTAVEDLISACEAASGPFQGRLRLGVIPTIAPFLLPKLLNRLRQVHPQFQLFIREDLSANLVEGLQQGQLDVILLALPYPMDNIETMPLFNDEFFLACPQQHQLLTTVALHTGDLKQQELLLLEDGHCLRDHALQACKLNASDVALPYQATSLNTIVQMVANGIGITLLPNMALQANILQGTGVAVRSFDELDIARSIGLAWRKQCPRAAEFRLLGEFVIQHLE